MTGPGKRDDELAAAVTACIGVVTVESLGELGRLDVIAARLRRRQPILLRLAVADDAKLERVRLIGGAAGKFGMPLPVLREAAGIAAASPNLELLGVHAFGASNLLDANRLADHVAELVAVAEEVAAEAGVPLRLVDAGGGLGIPYADGEQPLDLALLGTRLEELRGRWDRDPALREMEVLLEPGRFLVGPAGAYVARVVDVKGTDKAPVAILDGGINHLVRPALVRQEHRLAVLAPDADSRDRVPTTVAGPLCTGLDVFTLHAKLPRPRVGDLIAVLDAGAYGFTESMPFFLSHPTAAEIAVRGGHACLIRPRCRPATSSTSRSPHAGSRRAERAALHCRRAERGAPPGRATVGRSRGAKRGAPRSALWRLKRRRRADRPGGHVAPEAPPARRCRRRGAPQHARGGYCALPVPSCVDDSCSPGQIRPTKMGQVASHGYPRLQGSEPEVGCTASRLLSPDPPKLP